MHPWYQFIVVGGRICILFLTLRASIYTLLSSFALSFLFTFTLIFLMAIYGILPVLAVPPLVVGGDYYWAPNPPNHCISSTASGAAACAAPYLSPGPAGQDFVCFDGGCFSSLCHIVIWESGTCLHVNLLHNYPGPPCSTGFIDPKGVCTEPFSQNQLGATTFNDQTLYPLCTNNGITGMCTANAHTMLVSLHLNDTPVGYQPQVGPAAYIRLSYNHKEAGQPTTFTYFNVGPKWTLNILSFIQDDPENPGQSVMRYVGGGGFVNYRSVNGSFNVTTGAFSPELQTSATLVRIPAVGVVASYELRFPDGAKHVFTKLDGATTKPRRVFLTQIVDSAGNTMILNYDSSLRLTSITDAVGRNTTFVYGNANPLLVTKIIDPFGRFATLIYDSSGRLVSIKDVIDMTSFVIYDAADPTFIETLITPYGSSNFAYGENYDVNSRWLEMTDPLGKTERLEFMPNAPGIDATPSPVPTGSSITRGSFALYNSFYWDRYVYPLAITRSNGIVTGQDYTKAEITHWLTNTSSQISATPGAIKKPLENYVFFNYPGQTRAHQEGTLATPTAIGRVLDNGTTQLHQATYNTLGKPLTVTDPLGRVTQFTYASNDIDLLKVEQQTASSFVTIAVFGNYNAQHVPQSYTDAAGKLWQYGYNAVGQLTSITDPNGNVTRYDYDAQHRLSRIINANNITMLTLTYDAYDRVATRTDSEGHTLAYEYDALDRVTKITWPDSTFDQYTWTRLDLTRVKDRLGRIMTYKYDANRRLIQMTEPVDGTITRTTKISYYANGALKSMTDPNGNVTRWTVDLQSRPTVKRYADGTTERTIYEATTSRIKKLTDALQQVKHYTYGLDDRLTKITYTNAANPTPNVRFFWDTDFPRLSRMTDGTGTTRYTYVPAGTNGALQLATVNGPFANDTITTTYDALGRLRTRNIAGGNESFAYDAISRLSAHTTGLGIFTYDYLGQTMQVTSRSLNGTGINTAWDYDANANDRRLKAITHSGVSRSYALTSNPYQITAITDTAPPAHPWITQSKIYGYDLVDRLLTATANMTGNHSYAYDKLDNAVTVTDSHGTVNPTYNNLNQLTAWGTNTYSYDLNGNVTSGDGVRTYKWDAENRLVEIAYVGASNKTTFAYNGLGQRIAITETVNGVDTTTRVLWCGSRICQARNGSDTVTRRVLVEGEIDVATGQKLIYLQDHLGSVRDVLNATTGALVAALDYSSYGEQVRSWGSLTPTYQYAGLQGHADSGLYLSVTRPYDPVTGRWLGRDPIRETGGINLYGYVGGDPVSQIDPNGLISFSFDAYLGIGWGMTIGIDNGQSFFSVRAGVGFGVGVEMDPLGRAPGEAPCKDTSLGGKTIALFAQASAPFYGLSVGTKGEWGLRKDVYPGPLYDLFEDNVGEVVTLINRPLGPLTTPVYSGSKFGIGASVGIEVGTIVTPKSPTP